MAPCHPSQHTFEAEETPLCAAKPHPAHLDLTWRKWCSQDDSTEVEPQTPSLCGSEDDSLGSDESAPASPVTSTFNLLGAHQLEEKSVIDPYSPPCQSSMIHNAVLGPNQEDLIWDLGILHERDCPSKALDKERTSEKTGPIEAQEEQQKTQMSCHPWPIPTIIVTDAEPQDWTPPTDSEFQERFDPDLLFSPDVFYENWCSGIRGQKITDPVIINEDGREESISAPLPVQSYGAFVEDFDEEDFDEEDELVRLGLCGSDEDILSAFAGPADWGVQSY